MPRFCSVSGAFCAGFLFFLMFPPFQAFPLAEAVRSFKNDAHLIRSFQSAPLFRNADGCGGSPPRSGEGDDPSACDRRLIHIAITLDEEYLRGSIAAVHSVLRHAQCPESVFVHFLAAAGTASLAGLVRSSFPELRFKIYLFDPDRVRGLISASVRQALEHPLNYARNYLAEVLEPCVERVVYLDSDLVVVDDVAKLWMTPLGGSAVGAPEYCHANFTKYFTGRFWSDRRWAGTFDRRRPCYFNTGVMVLDLERWRRSGHTREIERWMEVQRKEGRIYELGSLPPFLLTFAGRIAPIDHRWNQHGLGGDNVKGSCRDLHPGPVSLLHWSGSGKPWLRLDAGRPCPLDALWAPYDLLSHGKYIKSN